MSWQPPLPLLRTMQAALVQLAMFYPRGLAMARDESEAARAWLATYCRATVGKRISLEAITEAALRWPAEFGKETPYPAEFAAFAARIHDERHPEPSGEARPAPVRRVPRPPHADAVERMSRRAFDVLRGIDEQRAWTYVSHAWGLVWKMAQTDAERDDVRLGRVPDENWDQCIADTLHEFQRRAA